MGAAGQRGRPKEASGQVGRALQTRASAPVRGGLKTYRKFSHDQRATLTMRAANATRKLSQGASG